MCEAHKDGGRLGEKTRDGGCEAPQNTQKKGGKGGGKEQKRDKKHHVIGKCDYTTEGWTERSSARLVWHFNIVVFVYRAYNSHAKRAQYYSNKAR